MNPSLAEHEPRPAPKQGGARFTYPSGSRPLPGYTIKRGVGHGGFGEVYYAVSDAGKDTALKLIRRNLDIELRGVTQCLNLKHPHLVTVYDIRQDEHDDHWVVMEFVAGLSLEDAIAQHPNGMPEVEALRWFRAIVSGVAYLHDHGIVHRDLKPGNIFDDEGIVKIGDYGLSKFISCSRRSGQTESVGTVHYMAPEIANGRYGKEIDIYALGVILYEMLTGQVPFDGESVGEVLMKHLTAEPNLQRVAEPYRSLIARSLTKDPDRRIHSAAEMLAALPAAVATDASPIYAGAAIPYGDRAPHGGDAPGRGPMPPPIGAEASARDGGAHDGVADRGRYEVAPLRDLEEPLARTIREGMRRFREWWQSDLLPEWLKVILKIVAVIALIPTAYVWIPLLFLYCVYWLIWALVNGAGKHGEGRVGHGSPPRAGPPPQPTANSALLYGDPTPATRDTVNWRTETPSPSASSAGDESPATTRRERLMRRARRKSLTWRPKTLRESATELLGSLLLSTLIVVGLTLVTALVFGASNPQQLTWLMLVGTAGAWMVLVPAKLWEGREGEPIVRRFTLMMLGLLLGVFAFSLRTWLYLELPMADWFRGGFSLKRFDANAIQVSEYAVYFGFLFLVPAWWKQADPRRFVRVSLWSTTVVVGWAFVLSMFWQFPQPWAMEVAAIVSLATQMAAVRHGAD